MLVSARCPRLSHPCGMRSTPSIRTYTRRRQRRQRRSIWRHWQHTEPAWCQRELVRVPKVACTPATPTTATSRRHSMEDIHHRTRYRHHRRLQANRRQCQRSRHRWCPASRTRLCCSRCPDTWACRRTCNRRHIVIITCNRWVQFCCRNEMQLPDHRWWDLMMLPRCWQLHLVRPSGVSGFERVAYWPKLAVFRVRLPSNKQSSTSLCSHDVSVPSQWLQAARRSRHLHLQCPHPCHSSRRCDLLTRAFAMAAPTLLFPIRNGRMNTAVMNA